LPVVPDTDLLQDIDAETRLAWSVYSERTRELSGGEYERLEAESWDELQAELRRLESQRDAITVPIAHVD
jgi:hypothetical protein